MTTVCEYCENIITKNNLVKHQKTETCIKIQKLLINANNKYNNKLLEIENINKELLIKLQVLTEENNKLRTEIKTFEKSNEGYLKLVEIVNNKPDVIKKDNIKDNTFQIDIIMNNKQFNKTKYKDVPEDIVKKDIQSLKLKDNYQLEYREEDGYINITNLCKAGGKKFNDWNRMDKTKRFLEVLSTDAGIPVSELIK